MDYRNLKKHAMWKEAIMCKDFSKKNTFSDFHFWKVLV